MDNPKNAGMQKLTNKVMRGGAPLTQTTTEWPNFTSTSKGANKPTYSVSKDDTTTQRTVQKGGKNDKMPTTRTKTVVNEGSGDNQRTLTKTVKRRGGVEEGGSTKTKTKNIGWRKAQRIMGRQKKKALGN